MPKKAKQELVPEETLVGEVVEPVITESREDDIESFAQRVNEEMKERFWDEYNILFIKKDTRLFDALTRNINSWV